MAREYRYALGLQGAGHTVRQTRAMCRSWRSGRGGHCHVPYCRNAEWLGPHSRSHTHVPTLPYTQHTASMPHTIFPPPSPPLLACFRWFWFSLGWYLQPPTCLPVQERAGSLRDVESLQHQNNELRALLNQYLSSRINDELQIPPTQII